MSTATTIAASAHGEVLVLEVCADDWLYAHVHVDEKPANRTLSGREELPNSPRTCDLWLVRPYPTDGDGDDERDSQRDAEN